MQREECSSRGSVRQVHEKDFVEAAFAEHFGWKRGNVVGSGCEEDAAFAVLHPGQKGCEQALRESGIGVTAGPGGSEGFFNFVDPQDQRSHFLRQVKRLAQTFFAFTDEFVVERAGVEASQFKAPFAGNGLAAKLFPQPCTPVIRIPFGGTRPNFWPSAVKALLRLPIQSRRRCNPAISEKDESRRTVSSKPSPRSDFPLGVEDDVEHIDGSALPCCKNAAAAACAWLPQWASRKDFSRAAAIPARSRADGNMAFAIQVRRAFA